MSFERVIGVGMENETNTKTDRSSNFYKNGKDYWETVTPDVNGMLGGFGQITHTDIDGSARFLRYFLNRKIDPIGRNRVLDCGSGIGRVTKHLLLDHFDTVDMVEQNQKFIDESYNYITEGANKIERRICSALQEFMPETGRYDVIWCQWVLSHLVDEDVLKLFERCRQGLIATNGLLVVKDNVTASNDVEMDEMDSTISRPLHLWNELISKGGFEIVREAKQPRFPRELYQVRMFACQLPR